MENKSEWEVVPAYDNFETGEHNLWSKKVGNDWLWYIKRNEKWKWFDIYNGQLTHKPLSHYYAFEEAKEYANEKIKEKEKLLHTRVCDWCLEKNIFGGYETYICIRGMENKEFAREINQNITIYDLFLNYSFEDSIMDCNDYIAKMDLLGIEIVDENSQLFDKCLKFIDKLKEVYFGEIKNEPYYTGHGKLMNHAFEEFEGRWDQYDHTSRGEEMYFAFKENYVGLGNDYYVITNNYNYEPIGTTYEWDIEEALDELGIEERTEDLSI